jgi:hypothetical protein
MIYVRTEDLVNPANPRAGLRPGTPVEPLVLRARAGECVQVNLTNRLPATAPDLASWQDLQWVVNRELFKPVAQRDPLQMHFFNNNLIRPSSHVGMTPQLVEYDITRSEGTVVGINPADQVVPPVTGGVATTRPLVWYAGDLKENETIVGNQRRIEIVATPVEFGGANITPADQVKQGQKSLIGTIVIEPADATFPDTLAQLQAAGTAQQVPDNQGTGAATRFTRAQVTVASAANATLGTGGTFREAVMVPQKAVNFFWKDGTSIRGVKQNELGREGAEDAGHQAVNYAAEPGWFRFQLPPDAPFGNAGTPGSFGALDQDRYFANALVTAELNTIPAIAGVSAAGDPVTPVFRASAGLAGTKAGNLRVHMLTPYSTDRDSALHIAGHVWQRDPFVCTGAARNVTGATVNVVQDAQDPAVALAGRCDPRANVVSSALGYNMQGKWMGGEEGMGHGYGHWPILTKAGGTDGVQGDYLFKAWESWGNVNGLWGLVRVTP